MSENHYEIIEPVSPRRAMLAARLTRLRVAALAIGLLAIGEASAQDDARLRPGPGPTCIQTYRILDTRVVDAWTIDFRMRDGTVLRNRLSTNCPSLRFHGFAYRTHDRSLCAHDVIRVLKTRDVCVLGTFSRLPRPYFGH